ncbi:MAG: hypothetical protein HON53_01380 [Planctomycetaceae bacterium]|jgi:hypothetical protein|nr:hypothetical protein [Planctomycetaceae bacterium]MBT6154673.1 hypothetical protein [Planctomycetaceae bacterium]MBT6484749.1 hypothetical protein [Planctomycetaceae bacterium]MBT6494153.1 hypothetical protein [Planctomycetaceae bacterium]
MIATRQTTIRTYRPTVSSFVVAVALIPVLMMVTWPVAALLGDARTLLVEFIALPSFSVMGLGLILRGFSFEFNDDDSDVLVQHRVLLFRVGERFRIPLRTITSLDWNGDPEGSDLRMTVAGEKRYYVTMSKTKAKRIAQIVIKAQPNLKPHLHHDLI